MISLAERFAGLPEERRDYVLRDLPYHLVEAGMWNELAELFAESRFVLARSVKFGFAAIHGDASAACRSTLLTPEWRPALEAWERFLHWRIERLQPVPEAYASEVVNEFLPGAPEPLAGALAPLRDRYLLADSFYLKKILGPPALGAGHVGTVFAAAFSPDNRYMVLGSDDSTVKLWDTVEGRLVTECVGHQRAVRSVAYSPDGRLIASGSDDHTLKVWDAASGKLIANCAGHDGFVMSVAFSPDSRLVASGGGAVKVWQAETGRLVADCSGSQAAVYQLAFSSDGRLVVAGGGDKVVRAWEARAGRLLSEYRDAASVHALCFFPGSHTVVSGNYERTLKISDADTGAAVAASPLMRESIKCVAASPDGQLAAAAGVADSITVFDAATARPVWTLLGHREPVIALDFSSKGDLICHCPGWRYSVDTSSALASQNPAIAQMWETDTGKPLGEYVSAYGRLLSLDGSRDGRLLLTGEQGNIAQLWNLQTSQRVCACVGHDGPVKGVALSPDGSRIATASADKTVGIWDAQSGVRLFTCSGHTGEVNCVAFSPDGRVVASGGNDRTLRQWDAQSGGPVTDGTATEFRLPVERVGFDAAGQAKGFTAEQPVGFLSSTILAANGVRVTRQDYVEPGIMFSPDLRIYANPGRRIKYWDKRTAWRPPAQVSRASVIGNVAASAGGDVVALYDGGIVILDAHTGREAAKFACATDSRAIAFSPDHGLVAAAGADNVIRIWQTTTGSLTQSLKDEEHIVPASLAFSDDGRFLAAGGEQGRVAVWDCRSGELVARAGRELRHVSSVAFYPGGQYFAAGSNSVYVWETATGKLATQFQPPEDGMAGAMLPIGLMAGNLDGVQTVPMVAARQ